MVEINGIYKCSICGNVVSVLEAHDTQISCCGQEMEKLEEKTADEGKEKHIPVITEINGGIKVEVGSIPHPMEGSHFIEVIQLFKDGKLLAEKRLYPSEKAEAEFSIDSIQGVVVRSLCNIHGLWKS